MNRKSWSIFNIPVRLWNFPLWVIFLSATSAKAVESFDDITCQSISASTFIGRHMPSELVKLTEARYTSIGLKIIGAFGMEIEGDPWTQISWEVCGQEYLLLEQSGIVKDALVSPVSPGGPKSEIGSCSANGLNLQEIAIIFVESNDKHWPKSVKNAWLINDKTIKFEKIEGNEIICAP